MNSFRLLFDVLNKYTSNEKPSREDIVYWLVDVAALVECKDIVDFEKYAFYQISIADSYITQALKRKYNLKDAVTFIKYSILQKKYEEAVKKNLMTLDMNKVIDTEKDFYKNVLKILRAEKFLH